MFLKDTYHSVKGVFTDLVVMSEDELTSLEEKASKNHLRKETNRAILVNYLAVFVISFFPFILVATLRFFGAVSDFLLSKQGHYDDSYISLAMFSLILPSMGLVLYFFSMP